MTLARYMVRRQDDGRYCIWDHMTKRPAEDGDRRYIDLDFEDALKLVRPLNNPQQVRDDRGA